MVVVAAGNDGPDEDTIRTSGINPKIITVGASDDHGTIYCVDDTIAQFSSRCPTIDGFDKPDIIAPGVNGISLMDDTSYVPKKKDGSARTPMSLSQAKGPTQTTDQYYVSMSGTSMATPVASGIIAIMKPWINPRTIKKYFDNELEILLLLD